MKVETAKIHPDQLKKVEPQKEVDVSLVTNDMPIRAIGMAVLVSTIGVLGTWSYLAPIASSAAGGNASLMSLPEEL